MDAKSNSIMSRQLLKKKNMSTLKCVMNKNYLVQIHQSSRVTRVAHVKLGNLAPEGCMQTLLICG
jgi:allantoicase